ncbi:MAG: hypothetical protein IPL09_03205 [Bacteroidetes bacterium]|jgi:hypothetical protein|nr:hypothetical protein [Bacteroidota bacterium]MBK8328494.1 hypothetical protein [Bacteroidota bacterium]MBK9483447.1 hypothetical protein [Bacteroidota bacterium]
MIQTSTSQHIKKGFLLGLFFMGLGCQHLFAYIEGGYRVGLWLNAGKLNNIIREYNIQNPWQAFKPVHMGLGGRVVFGAQSKSVAFFAGLKWLRNSQTVSGTDPSTQSANYKRLTVHYGGIVFGMHTTLESPVSVGLELNAFNYYVLRLQESNTPNVKAATSNELVNDVNPNLSFFVRLALQKGVAGITLIPAIDLPVLHGRNDISDLRKPLKLYTPSSDTYVMRGYNISLTLSILLAKKRDW